MPPFYDDTVIVIAVILAVVIVPSAVIIVAFLRRSHGNKVFHDLLRKGYRVYDVGLVSQHPTENRLILKVCGVLSKKPLDYGHVEKIFNNDCRYIRRIKRTDTVEFILVRGRLYTYSQVDGRVGRINNSELGKVFMSLSRRTI